MDAAEFYKTVRQTTEHLCEPLAVEDYGLQSMPDTSPVKWQLAHTTWFFETFVLLPHFPDYQPFHPQFGFLFNSYYNAVGPRWPRPQRGLLSRPTVAEIGGYRKHVDRCMEKLLASLPAKHRNPIESTVVLGCHHEQQHQELILTDLKHAWALNPLDPVYRPALPERGSVPSHRWLSVPGGVVWLGHDGQGFAFDNEGPRHQAFVQSFQLASRLVTNGEYLGFIQDSGYRRPELWLSDGWATRQASGWEAPLYWEPRDGEWWQVTLAGRRPVKASEPVCHVSYYEADAFARWAGARLPTEAEWETAAQTLPLAGHFLDAGYYHPAAGAAVDDGGPLYQLFGDVWQWTASPYTAYPGYQPAAGALGEYNGKFMVNQLVLRGASCATPRSHARHTYRNFFPPDVRWQFSGIRLARDA
ncbi:MAG TPA: ergothioneine biosynthesis protein EgtB [Gemmataceae bacterium]|nr:ergothioneine biosynthesis protein EgtB [Gemmataceae bacterium]